MFTVILCQMSEIVNFMQPYRLSFVLQYTHEEDKQKPAKLVKRKMLILKEFPIEKFMMGHYLTHKYASIFIYA